MSTGAGGLPPSSTELPDPRGERLSRRALVGGAAGFVVAAPVLHFGAELALLDAILLPLLLVVMPALALAQASLLRRLSFERLPAYWSSIVTLFLLGAASALAGARRGGAEALGLVPLPLPALLGWSLALAVVGVAVLLGFRVFGRRFAIEESRMLVRLLPRTRPERRVFALLSLAAGVGEEVAYRGYVIPALALAVGVPASVAVSSLVFGLLHAYQGPIGVARTALMGFVLAGGFLVSGSLLPVMIAHVLIDLVGGLVIAEWFLRGEAAPEPEAGETDASGGASETTDTAVE